MELDIDTRNQQSTMSQYKLIYFNGRGRAELARLLFAVGGVKYEDQRHEMNEWPAVKAKLNAPFGQVPLLSIDGQLYSQSVSIARYLAEKFGLAGKTDLDKLRADMIVHCLEDVVQKLYDADFEPDAARKETLVKSLKEETGLKTQFTNLEKILKQNKGGDSYFVGDSLTWADLSFIHHVDYVSAAGFEAKTFLAAYPKLKALHEKVTKQPKVAEWIAKRPATPW